MLEVSDGVRPGRVPTAPIQEAGRVTRELAPAPSSVELLNGDEKGNYGGAVWPVWTEGAVVTWIPRRGGEVVAHWLAIVCTDTQLPI